MFVYFCKLRTYEDIVHGLLDGIYDGLFNVNDISAYLGRYLKIFRFIVIKRTLFERLLANNWDRSRE